MYGPLKYLPYIVAAIIALGIGAFLLLDPHDPGKSIPEVAAGAAGGGGDPVEREKRDPAFHEGVFTQGHAKPAEGTVGSWPGFAGPDRTVTAGGEAELATSWPAGGPPRLWERTVCNGHAGVAIFQGRVYLTDYDKDLYPNAETGQPEGGDIIRCMSLVDGKDIWTYHYGPVTTKNNHGITRPIPAVDEKYLVSYGPKAQVHCLDSMTGAYKWSRSMEGRYGGKAPNWYAGQCPLLEPDGTTVLAPSGPDILMIKVRCDTGEIIWEADNTLGGEQTHVSVMRMAIDGTVPCYLYTSTKGLHGIDAKTGEVLFESQEWKISIAACASACVLPDNHIFLCAGYGVGGMLVRVDKNPDSNADTPYLVVPLFRTKEQEFGSINHTPVPYDGAIWGIRPSGEFICMEPAADKKSMDFHWTSTRKVKYGDGPYLMAPQQGLIYALEEHGRLDMIKVDKGSFQQLGSCMVWPDAKDAWGPMALAGDRLILRELKRMVCLDVGAK